MVHKYTLARSRDQIHNQFGVKTSSKYKPVYNACPGSALPVITNENKDLVDFVQWGIIPYDSVDPLIGEKLLHAKLELIKAKRPFADLITKQRCLIPADGFIIWSDEPNPTPFRVTLKTKEIFSIAGIWDRWEDEYSDDSFLRTFAMVTMPATESIRKVSDRIPAILLPEFEQNWLDTSLPVNEVINSIKPLPDELFEMHQLNPDIISTNENSQDLIKGLNAKNPGENFSLF